MDIKEKGTYHFFMSGKGEQDRNQVQEGMAQTETIEGLEVPGYKDYINNKEIIGRHTSISRMPLFGRERSRGQRLATGPLSQSKRDQDRSISRRN